MINGRFAWDEDKHDVNKRKHGIDFYEAATVFDDPNATTAYDFEHSYDEDRFVVIGFSENMRLLMVCHCYKENGIVRLISARKATKGETKLYGGA